MSHFPLVIEALLIHFIYELMREAGLRLPRPIGHAIGIIGALVIGDAAVTAGLISSPMVMVVALTALSSFVVPSLFQEVTIMRFGFIIIGGTLGVFGISLGLALMIVNLCSVNVLRNPPAWLQNLRFRCSRCGMYCCGPDGKSWAAKS